MKEIRIFSIPDELLKEGSAFLKISKPLLSLKEKNKELYEHTLSTANFTYMYCSEYEPSIDKNNMYSAAVLFNYWKINTPMELITKKEKTFAEEQKITNIMQTTQKDILKNVPKEITDILYVVEEKEQKMYEIIYTCNALDNLLCLKNADDDNLSIISALTILAISRNFNPVIVKNFKKFFQKKITASAEEFKISFTSKEEMKSFNELKDDVKDSLLSAVSMITTEDDSEIVVKEMKNIGGKQKQIVMFDSNTQEKQRFYDKYTNTLYEM